MSWTKVTKATSGAAVAGWGDMEWGNDPWGSPAGTAWVKQSDSSDTWILRDILYDSAVTYDSATPYSSGWTVDTWTKVADAI